MTGAVRASVLRFAKDRRGTAAVEMVLWLSAMALPILNVVDLGLYVYQRMQVETAAEAAVNAAWKDCDPTANVTSTMLPATVSTACPKAVSTLFTDMQAAAQSTTLGTAVTLPLASISESYYCANSAGGLILQGAIGTAASLASSAPTRPNCSGTGTPPAGDYIQATVTYTYTPLFPGMSILSVLGTTVTKTAWLRLDQ